MSQKVNRKTCSYKVGLYSIADNNNADFTVEDQSSDIQSNLFSEENIPEFKKGLNLPKKDSEWATANDYFKFRIPLNGMVQS